MPEVHHETKQMLQRAKAALEQAAKQLEDAKKKFKEASVSQTAAENAYEDAVASFERYASVTEENWVKFLLELADTEDGVALTPRDKEKLRNLADEMEQAAVSSE